MEGLSGNARGVFFIMHCHANAPIAGIEQGPDLQQGADAPSTAADFLAHARRVVAGDFQKVLPVLRKIFSPEMTQMRVPLEPATIASVLLSPYTKRGNHTAYGSPASPIRDQAIGAAILFFMLVRLFWRLHHPVPPAP
ncbi:MAG TPA: hypothetical protein VJL82_08320 [Rhizomicrobium sp.]|nr:hypothetical protein [Rhizomicrobium sp.]